MYRYSEDLHTSQLAKVGKKKPVCHFEIGEYDVAVVLKKIVYH